MVFSLNEATLVEIRIYTYLGNLVLIHHFGELQPAGPSQKYIWDWDGRDGQGFLQKSGGYVCMLTLKNQRSVSEQKFTKKLAIIRQ
jgi:hypothetical protein